jgi:dihydrofolate reductase
MGKVVADVSVSLDGFVTGPGPDLAHGLGHGGDPLHSWAVRGDAIDAEILREAVEATGAVLMGRRTFDFVDGPHGWSAETGYGGGPEGGGAPPVFVVTHEVPATVRLGPRFRFVTDGVDSAVAAARAAAGDKDVFVMGGGDLIRQCVRRGLADELRLHLAPVLLGDGTPLFSRGEAGVLILEQFDVRVSAYATHLRYRVPRP